MGSFTPLVFSTFGGMGSAATTVYKRIASLLSAKREQPYSLVMSRGGYRLLKRGVPFLEL